ncbi:uncharacterized protein LOC144704502 [Wolffia australiana]
MAGENGKRKNKMSVWTEEHDIKLLRVVLYCQRKYNADPSSSVDLIAKHARLIMKMKINRTQVSDTIHRLKSLWENAADLSEPINPHDRAVCELARKIWKRDERADEATDGDGEGRVGSDCLYLSRAVEQLVEENACFEGRNQILKGYERLNPATAAELDARWKAHVAEGLKIFLTGCKIKNEILQACVESFDLDDW